MNSIFQINKILILVLLLIGTFSPSSASLFDNWTDNQLCEWMDQPSPPGIIQNLVNKRKIVCSEGEARQLSASEIKAQKLAKNHDRLEEEAKAKVEKAKAKIESSKRLETIEVSDAFDGSFSFNFTGVDEGRILGFGYGTLNIKNGEASISKDSQGIAKLKYQSFEGRVDKNGDLIATLFFNPGHRWNAMVDKLIVFEGNIDKKKLSGMYDDVKLYFYLVKK
tara:strand:+ start:196 stop:861 length:666 start_codon:yes stop_codon:yes gene_type:complete